MKVFLKKGKLPRLETARLILRSIEIEDISEQYIAWLNDPEVNKYLEIRLAPQTRELVVEYVLQHLDDIQSAKFFGVYTVLGGKENLIGTTKIHCISPHHLSAQLSYVIGYPEASGKGYATESVHAACAYMFFVENMHRLYAGFYADNIGSQKVLLKNNFQQEGVLREARIDAFGKRTDDHVFGLLRHEFQPNPVWLGDNGEVLTYDTTPA